MSEVAEEFLSADADPGDPGWGLGELLDLDGDDFAELSVADAARLVCAADQLQAMLQAQKLRAMQAYRLASGNDEWAHDTVAAERKVSMAPVRARYGLGAGSVRAATPPPGRVGLRRGG